MSRKEAWKDSCQRRGEEEGQRQCLGSAWQEWCGLTLGHMGRSQVVVVLRKFFGSGPRPMLDTGRKVPRRLSAWARVANLG